MRASRLVQLLLLLQTRGRSTAPQLARELEVSVRTVYRDIEALSAAGVPVYTEPGRAGGVELVDGYRTRLTGLTSDEADAVLLAGLPGAAADLGLGTVLATAQLKVLAALPPELRGRATRIADRVHIDAPGWFHRPDETPTLATVADALWHDRRLAVRYARKDRTVERALDPLGLVLKAGTWYLVAREGNAVRSYRVGRIESAVPNGETFDRPQDFDLTAHWADSAEEFARSMLRVRARCRIAGTHLGLLRLMNDPAAVAEALASARPPDADGWVELTVPSESWDVLVTGLLPLGESAEVLDPPELRARFAATAAGMHALYRGAAQVRPPQHDARPSG
ncbi:YafY family transcriptional regulator [Nocardia cyriacigeorgica]|uniref:YafY family transcriptional regulator n=1 Tax=Nocardia cyriacigeorgica TaxID=135487 RepID=A0A6P1D168_9NOCA|nr:YafY family protein [Nocardia cyriacigeorgica]NEW41622.1 YafY family transcriptional regulator [Nocardia cyriacigeorgica]NEW44107.1 YafY family transcriptional regulator [Nocardia cyriacigeorgica]NEW52304.1 YafY family transcriptional regulator [Nocardia cyriacigeorgica]NEW56290.1 YafY family transcriptional regulator [Nocardia cyriacigeorgica]